jgi:hypothetical protein
MPLEITVTKPAELSMIKANSMPKQKVTMKIQRF